ncbi:MAG: replication restart helicase PriA, partial [Spirochaetia bacterium]
ALTGQLHAVVSRRFADTVALIHSRMTPSQRLTEWRRLRSGRARIAMGARSAVFAPLSDIGLIVVDEEHEGSYKSAAAPRYHARQVALYRARQVGARIVFGSATPSVEAAALMNSGTLKRLRLTRRLAGGSTPVMETVDLRRDPGILSTRLADEIRRTHERGLQTILFLNRRGFANFFQCRSCGYRMTCPRCSVSLTYHKGRVAMVCHHCGYRTRPPELCPECGSLDISFGGYGTERVEEQVRNTFPNLTCARVDADTMRKKGVLENTLSSFRDGAIDILLGTQMVAKGLNFPSVGLVGIVLADSGLAMPDFRAGERTWSLIVQVAGRAGRFRPDGKVLVQTYNPEHPAVAAAVADRRQAWYETELAARRELGFPPYSRLFRVVMRSRTKEKAAAAAGALADAAAERFGATEELLGPAECPLSVVNGSYRYHVLILSRAFDATHAGLTALLSKTPVPSGVFREVDVDPVALL